MIRNLQVFAGVVDEIGESFYFGTKKGPSGSDDEHVKFARLDCSHFILIEKSSFGHLRIGNVF